MKSLRQIHLYLGCIFAPLILYFALSGAWQVSRWNDLPKNEPPSRIRVVLHELSKPHKESTAPGADPKKDRSALFNGLAFFMALGLISTTSLGIVLAVRSTKSAKLAWVCLGLGFLLPILLLLVR